MTYADSKNDLRLLIKLQSETDASYLSNAADELQVEEDSNDHINRF